MHPITIVYWRDIPAQVIVGRGRRAAKAALPERFEQAIDRAAMRAGLAGTDDYLAEWRKVEDGAADGDAEAAMTEAVRALEAGWPDERLRAAAMAGGVEA